MAGTVSRLVITNLHSAFWGAAPWLPLIIASTVPSLFSLPGAGMERPKCRIGVPFDDEMRIERLGYLVKLAGGSAQMRKPTLASRNEGSGVSRFSVLAQLMSK